MLFAAFAVCRYLGYSTSILIFGTSAMLALSGSCRLNPGGEAALRALMHVAAVIGTLAVLCLLPLQVATIANDWLAVADPDMLATVALQTHYGQAWCLRTVGAVLVLGTVLGTGPGHTRLRALVAGLALLPLSLSGHAAMADGWAGLVHVASDSLHCLAAGFWLGSLPIFLYFLGKWQEPARRLDATRALLRFSTAGHIAVAVLLVSGVINAILILQPAGLDLASCYQQLLLAKMLLALAMVGLAIVNRYRWIPRLRQAPDSALHQIRHNTMLELWGGGAILLMVGFLGLMAPR